MQIIGPQSAPAATGMGDINFARKMVTERIILQQDGRLIFRPALE